eukprot:jgi/Ulvmu1/3181/UM015_0222.1
MSASVVPPPPPPEAPPPLPEEPPPPTTPPEPMEGVQQYVDVQQSHYYQTAAGNAAYPYAQQPMYQYPLQQPYTQAYNPYTSYTPYNAWQAPAVQHQYASAPAHATYPSTQPYQVYVPAPAVQPLWETAAATVPAASAATTPLNSTVTGTISFSLDGSSRKGAPAAARLSMASDVPAQRPLSSAQRPIHATQAPAPVANGSQTDKGQALKDWIKRALQKYDSHDSDSLRQTMKIILEEKRAQGVLYTHDWDREPLPVLPPTPLPAPAASQSFVFKMPDRRESPQQRESSRKAKSVRQLDRGPPVSDLSCTVAKRKKKANKHNRDRSLRFASASEGLVPDAPPEPVWNPDVVIQGTCLNIEKSFLRLNGVPKPEEVRPEPVLIKALDRIVAMIAGGEKDFMYIWSQLKAIRQDLTVQHIRNTTTVRTEEAFARSALEHSDQQEFRKCVSTLQAMYDEGLSGCKAEFGAYQLLLYICIEQKDRALSFSRAVVQLVSQGIWDTPEVQHAMGVCQAITSCNYVQFWNMYATAPNCGRLIMDWGIRKLRFEAVQGLVMSYRMVPLEMCMRVLGYAHNADHIAAECPGILPGSSAPLCVGAAGVTGNEADRETLCMHCIHAHGGMTNVGPNGKSVFLAKESAGKIGLPKQEQSSARAVGNTHLDCTAFLKDVTADRPGNRFLS